MGSSEVRYGFFAGVASIVWAAISLFMKWPGTTIGDIFDFAGIIIIAAGVYYAVKEKKAEQGVLFTFGNAFFTGCVTCFVVAIMMGSFYYLYSRYIDPWQVEAKVKEGIAIMTTRKYNIEQIKRGELNIRAMYSPNGQFMTNSGLTMFYGLVVSLIVAVFMAKRKPDAAK